MFDLHVNQVRIRNLFALYNDANAQTTHRNWRRRFGYSDAFVGQGVIIGKRAIVGARAVIMKDIQADAIALANLGKIVFHRNQIEKIMLGCSYALA